MSASETTTEMSDFGRVDQAGELHSNEKHDQHKPKKTKKHKDKEVERPSLDKNIRTSTLKPGELEYVR